MPLEKFPLLETPEATLQSWKRKLEYLFSNLDDANVTSSSLSSVKASNVLVTDGSSYYTAGQVEGVLDQIGSTIRNLASSNVDFSTGCIIGGSSDYSKFEADGTLVFTGNATIFHDELQSLLFQSYVNPAADITINSTDSCVVFSQACNIDDYAAMNIQINHGWKVGSAIYPHLHWWQTSSNVPNWLIQYRWQYNGSAKQSSWTYAKRSTEIYPFVTGSTINQITTFGSITPTSDADLSDIIQFRLIRDGDNQSSAFSSTDPLTGNVSAVNFDVHVEIDMFGSRSEFSK